MFGKDRPVIRVLSITAALYIAGLSFATAEEGCFTPSLRLGMNYTQSRDVIAKAGFQYVDIEPFSTVKEAMERPGKCLDPLGCDRVYEIGHCNGPGRCEMTFSDARFNELVVKYDGKNQKNAKIVEFHLVCDRS